MVVEVLFACVVVHIDIVRICHYAEHHHVGRSVSVSPFQYHWSTSDRLAVETTTVFRAVAKLRIHVEVLWAELHSASVALHVDRDDVATSDDLGFDVVAILVDFDFHILVSC